MSTRKAALLASTATTPPVVTGAGVRETITLGASPRPGQSEPPEEGKARTYVLAAPTLAEVGAFLEAQARRGTPGQAELTEAIREALQADGGDGGVLDAMEDAEDAWVSFSSIHVITGPDATESIQERATELHRDLLKARRERDRAVVKVGKHEKVLAIKAEQQAAQWRENCGLVALLLRDWNGGGLPAFPGALDAGAVEAALPMGDVAALAQRAFALMQPTAEVGKA